MRISDWSSDVCSSDLEEPRGHAAAVERREDLERVEVGVFVGDPLEAHDEMDLLEFVLLTRIAADIAARLGGAEHVGRQAAELLRRQIDEALVLDAPCRGDRKSTRLNSSH